MHTGRLRLNDWVSSFYSIFMSASDPRKVTDYGDENPLLMDYYVRARHDCQTNGLGLNSNLQGFPPELYALKFKSKGDSTLAKRIVELYKEVHTLSRNATRFHSYLHISMR